MDVSVELSDQRAETADQAVDSYAPVPLATSEDANATVESSSGSEDEEDLEQQEMQRVARVLESVENDMQERIIIYGLRRFTVRW